VLGSIAAASSPTLTMAVIDELDARVPFSRVLLSVTVVKDIVVIVLFSLALVVGRAVGSPGTVNAGVAWVPLLRLGASVAAGALLGLAVACYLRLVRRGAVVFLVALALLAVQTARMPRRESCGLSVAGAAVPAAGFR